MLHLMVKEKINIMSTNLKISLSWMIWIARTLKRRARRMTRLTKMDDNPRKNSFLMDTIISSMFESSTTLDDVPIHSTG